MTDPYFRLSDQSHAAGATSRMPGFVTKTLAVLSAVLLTVVGFMFTLTALAVAMIVVLLGWAYVGWKTRDLRKQMRESGFDPQAFQARAFGMGQAPGSQSDIIEGEVIRAIRPDDRRQ